MCINDSGHLEIGGCDTVDLARQFGTPLYVFDEQEIRTRCRAYIGGLRRHYPHGSIIYAGKAFLTQAVCRIIEEEGLCLDVVSGGELFTALSAGFPPERIFFHGNNKSLDEIACGIKVGVHRFVVDNLYELEMLETEAAREQTTANVLLRIAPGVEAHTHSYLRTGQVDSKFGFGLEDGRALEAIEVILQSPHLRLLGLHAHIGSQIFEVESYRLTTRIMVSFIGHLRSSLGVSIEELNLGGGLGIRYSEGDAPFTIETLVEALAATLSAECHSRGLPLPRLLLEPGRSIVGEAGTTLYTIGGSKEIPGVRKYVFVDGGMADNPRVALYQAEYEAIVANKARQLPSELVTIAGKCCESGDILIWDVELPPSEPGDILAVLSTGAYNYSMASNYNRLTRPAAVLVYDGEADLIVRRETLCDLIRQDCIPRRLRRQATNCHELSGTNIRI
ncbi:MAG: diaminopimelate decarboxylase [Limnochordia bacterium]|jgi:diaminopimelate decarboxylase